MSRGVSKNGNIPNVQMRSSRGGYLCCPFTLNPSFSGAACGYTVPNVGSKRNRYGSDCGTDEDDGEGFTRPWVRAGVGARSLGAKERRQQQDEARRIYGPGSMSREEADEPGATLAESAGTTAFGLTRWEQSALQKVLPRAEHRKGGRMHTSNKHSRASDEDEEKGESSAKLQKAFCQREVPCAARRSRAEPSSLSSHRADQRTGNKDVGCDELRVSVRNDEILSKGAKPMNNLKMLDRARDAILSGNRRGGRNRR
uniref:Uncharacterized protein TCIL3000_6_2300 n=1 Tax=Trypanosoma congolense (strain IL3000) TaxID=1068625 RepID=G0UNM9_TRYCI|nr:unnamed protein product [Trypanosoma congolense IL3000]